MAKKVIVNTGGKDVPATKGRTTTRTRAEDGGRETWVKAKTDDGRDVKVLSDRVRPA